MLHCQVNKSRASRSARACHPLGEDLGLYRKTPSPKQSFKIISCLNLFLFLILYPQTNMQTYQVCLTEGHTSRVLRAGYEHTPCATWSLILSLSLCCYGLCKLDLLTPWGRVWANAKGSSSGIDHSWKRWVAL